jgi:hypothetical protein
MSRLIVPVLAKPLWATADVRLWITLVLSVRDGAGNYVNQEFRVDSATDITTFPAHEARRLGLVVPAMPAAVHHPQTGLEVRAGMLRFRVDGMDQTEYAVSCLLLGDPNAGSPPGTPAGLLPRKLLQPLALLEKLRFTMEKDLTGQNQYGQLVVEKV